MATNTFERKIEISSEESLEKIAKILSDETPPSPISVEPYSQKDRNRNEQLLRQLLSRIKS